MKTRKHLCWLLGVVLLFSLNGTGNAQARKGFEAASIRPEDPRGSSRPSSRVSPGRFEIVGASPGELIARAFGIEHPQRLVAPDWVRRERFAIRAVMPDGTTERDIPEMLKTLLEQRFSLKMHVEQRPFEVYELVALKSGPTFREVGGADDCANLVAARISMAEFSRMLRPSVDRPVVDKTGLSGLYELKTLLPPARVSAAAQALLGDRLDKTPSGISVSRALEELGLKLEPKNAPVDFIVIENIERPSTD